MWVLLLLVAVVVLGLYDVAARQSRGGKLPLLVLGGILVLVAVKKHLL